MSAQAPKEICFHCGSECGKGAPIADGHRFCCQGCVGVYELLRAHNACEYYDFDDPSGRKPSGFEGSRFAAFDTAFMNRTNRPQGSVSTVILRVPDMHCAGCVWLLERLYRFDQGIVSSRVDLLHRTIAVDYRETGTSPSAIARLLDSLGYTPVLERPTSRKGRVHPERRKLYTQLGIAGFAAGNVMMVGLAHYIAGPQGLDPTVDVVLRTLELGLSILVLTLCATPWLGSALRSLRRGVVNLDVPVAIGITTIFLRSIIDIAVNRGEGFLDSFTGLIFFLLVGRLFQHRAIESLEFDRSMRSFFPVSASRLSQGEIQDISVDDLQRGDTVLVRNGEVIPADSILLHSVGVVDYAYLTGESEPVECRPGTMLYAGGRVLGRSLQLSVVKPSSTSSMASLWSRQDIHTERRAVDALQERFGLVFTVSVLSLAVLAGLYWLPNVEMALTVFSSVVIIACPCALTLSMPITYGTAMGLLAQHGLFLKNISALGELQLVTDVVFDKTGTLTEPHRVEFVGVELDADTCAAFAAMAVHSTHPISRAIVAASPPSRVSLSDVEEISGLGVRCHHNGHELALGSTRLLGNDHYEPSMALSASGSVAIVDGHVVGQYVIRHTLYSGIDEMISALRSRALNVHVVSGDSERGRDVLGKVFDDAEIHLSATPNDKVEIIKSFQSRGRHVMMVGDGLNDITAMSSANVSIAVSNGSSRIVPACDIMIDASRVAMIDRLIGYARSQGRVVQSALWFTMAYNALGISLAASGRLSPVITAVLMPVSSLLVLAISVFGARSTFRRISWV
jgi:Cu+-exporting ATPase